MLLELVREKLNIEPQKKTVNEYASPCPSCGGRDRFIIKAEQYWCRQCSAKGDAIEFCRNFMDMDYFQACERVGKEPKYKYKKSKKKSNTIYKPAKRDNIRSFKATPAPRPDSVWIQRAGRIVSRAHQLILRQPQVLKYLEQRGLPLDAVKRYKIGYIPKDIRENRSVWGLDEGKKIFLPKGILVPTLDRDEVVRLKIRQKGHEKLPKYIAVSGSMLGLNIIWGRQNIIVVVESELDAMALNYAAGDLCTAIAVGSNTKNPDAVSDILCRRAQRLLICADNDTPGTEMIKKWKGTYTHAEDARISNHKDIGEAIQNGCNIRKWLISTITGSNL